MFGTDHLLKRLIELTEEQLLLDWENNRLLRRIAKELAPINASDLTITQIGDPHMAALTQFDPGATGIVLLAAFTPAGSTAPSTGFTAEWTDSNGFCTFQNDPSDQTGLTQDVSVGQAATVGTSGIITVAIAGTFPDGTAANLSGQFSYTVGAAPVGNATGLSISQIA
jgi:hypothetical protein